MNIREFIVYLVVGYFFMIVPVVLYLLSRSTTFEGESKGKHINN